MKLDKTQRKELSKAQYDIGKLMLSALVLGYFISKSISIVLFISGIITFISLFIAATLLNKEDFK